MELQVKNIQGTVVGTAQVSDALFDVPLNQDLVHQALLMQLANARQGTSNTKRRDEVSGGGRKPWPQKHTGRARQGSIRSPQWRGGGIVFGPHPRDYRQHMPKAMRRKALRCLLSAKVKDGQLLLIDSIDLAEVKTKEMAKVLSNLGVSRSGLLVTPQSNPNVYLSAQNIEGVRCLPVHTLNVADLLKYDKLVMTVDAVRKAEELWASGRVRPRKRVLAQAAAPKDGQVGETS